MMARETKKLNRPKTLRRIECRVKVTDDWYPSIHGNLVNLRLYEGSQGNDRVYLVGDDDFHLYKDFDTFNEAEELYMTLIAEAPLNAWTLENVYGMTDR